MAGLVAQGWTRPVVFTQPAPALPSEQLVLFPRKSLIELPKVNGLDIYQCVIADNGRKYYLKLDRMDRYCRASEWLSYRLANLVGIPTPRCDFVQTFNGDIAFGSEDVVGVAAQAETARYLQTNSQTELGQPVNGLCAALSAIHAFDLFINNVDRHVGNFLVLGSGDERQLIALDFSRSFFWHWPMIGFPDSSTTTSEAWTELRQRHNFDLEIAISVVDRLGIITKENILSIISQMPSHWLPQSVQDDLSAYCGNGGWASRVAELRRGLISGSIV